MVQVIAKDNQWWYSGTDLAELVQDARYITLSIEGMECPMEHSQVGKDCRPTHSFKFLRGGDRDQWIGFRGTTVHLEFVHSHLGRPVIDFAAEDERNLVEPEPDAALVVSVVSMPDRVKATFDAYIFVDWSASARPAQGLDSIWIAEGGWTPEGKLTWHREPLNLSTRVAAEEWLKGRLGVHVKDRHRVLVGFDFPYAYPLGGIRTLRLGEGTPTDWKALWKCFAGLLRDNQDGHPNRNNRFEIANTLNCDPPSRPFWGRPAHLPHLDRLPIRRPAGFGTGPMPILEYRLVEETLRRQRMSAKSAWQLYGNGAVGSQILMGLPCLHRLTASPELATDSRIWPFDTGWMIPAPDARPLIVHAEIWPGAIEVQSLHAVRDAAQMKSYVLWAARHDSQGTLARYFDPLSKQPNSGADRDRASKEGWILGVLP